MKQNTANEEVSKSKLWTGRVLSGVAVIFLIFDGTIHLLKPGPVIESFNHLGYSPDISVTLGIIELFCLAIYLIPQTSIFGAVLLTGYLGGAVASQLRIGEPLFGYVLFPVYIGILLWGGIYLRDRKLQSIIPFRKGE
ncbi:MAG: DoxX family protein [Ignavibacteria bacterium]